LLAQLEGAVAGGVDLVQIRELDLEAGELAALVRDALRIAEGSSTRVIVNDRLDVAVSTGAHGVHLRERSFAAEPIRRRWPQLIMGRSVHSTATATHAGPVDYLIAGTVFASESKPAASATIGVEGLERIVGAAAGVAVLAIGGVTIERVGLLRRAGAHGLAAIGAFIPDGLTAGVAASVAHTAKTLRFAFDTDSTVS
jgi:thiamine-phosphate diphosphorylase